MAKGIIYSIVIERLDGNAEVAVSASDLGIAKGFLRTEVINYYYSLVDGFGDEDMYEGGDDYYEKGISLDGMEFIDYYFSNGTRFSVQENELW